MIKKAVIAVALFFNDTATTEIYTIDPAHSFVHFTINHMGFSDLTGRFNSMSGSMDLSADKSSGSVDVKIDPASVDTAHQKRDNHLRSVDFFNVKEFPEITFKSTEAKVTGNSGKLVGDLTIKGVTKRVNLDVTRSGCGVQPFNKNYTCGFNATTRINRSDFNITWGIDNNIVGDEVVLMIGAEGIKN
jgi:polyisoprenoid-binding protein YceI